MNMQKVLYSLTHPQKAIWYSEQTHPNTSIGNIAGTLKIKGEIDRILLEKAINSFIARNDAMRIRIIEVEGEPKQYIADYRYIKLDYYDFTAEDLSKFYQWEEQVTHIPFNMIDSALFYFAIIKVREHEIRVFANVHHIISDAWTMSLLGNYIIDIYSNLKNGVELPEEQIPSYIEYILSEKEYKKSDRFVKHRKFWEEKFKTIPEFIFLKSHAKYTSTKANRQAFLVSSHETSRFNEFCSKYQISFFTLFLAAFAVYINRITSKEDMALGTPVLNRSSAREKSVAGMFISTVPVRLFIDKSMDFKTFIAEVSKVWLTSLKNQKYPYDLLLKSFREEHKIADSIYDITLSYQNARFMKDKSKPEYKARWHFNGYQTDSLVIHINDRENKGYYSLGFDYLVDLFSGDEIDRMYRHLMNILHDAVENPTKKIYQLEIFSEAEKSNLLYGFNNTKTEYPANNTLHRLCEAMARKKPENTAVIFGDRHLTFQELNKKADIVANLLRRKGVKPESIVAIMLERSIELVIGILGILKAGGAYLPIDPDYPSGRITYILKDSGTEILLTQSDLVEKIVFHGEVIDLYKPDSTYFSAPYQKNLNVFGESRLKQSRSDDETPAVETCSTPNNLAYCIYTSGSTGAPKGVLIEHRSIVNTINWRMHYYNFNGDDAILQLASISFDSSVEDLFTSIIAGARLVLVTRHERLNPEYLRKVIKINKITHFLITPSLYKVLLEKIHGDLKKLKSVTIAGESFDTYLVNEHFAKLKNVRLYNEYGPTENSVCTTVYQFYKSGGAVSIGKPIYNNQCYILNADYNLQPVGISGEICISGAGLARGYLNQLELTASKFVFRDTFSARIYKTGDLARWLSDGNIEFLGRIDHQIKIRGYRVELGEIENRLSQFPSIRGAVALLKENSSGDKKLCAYIVSNEDISIATLKEYLRANLPDYMIPTCFVKLQEMPLTSNGKIDRNALPDPGPEEHENKIIENDEEEKTETEIKLEGLWRDILGIDGAKRIGTERSFFELGGDSLNAINLMYKINKEFGAEILVQQIFELKTIKKIAQFLTHAKKVYFTEIEPISGKDYYPVSSAQKRLFIIAQMEGIGTCYNLPVAMLIEGNLERPYFEEAFRSLIKRHEALRTSFHFINGEVLQKIHENTDFDVSYFESRKNIDDIVKEFIRPFDLSEAPLLRVQLVKLGHHKYLFMFDIHHIITDGISAGILIRDFIHLYEGKTLPEVRAQYKDFSVWQNKLLNSGRFQSQEKYWLKVFSEKLPALNLPADYPRPAAQSFEGDKTLFHLEQKITEAMGKFAAKTETTLFMVLLAIYNVLLYKYTGQEDITVGSPISGRDHADLGMTVGMFVNTLSLRHFPKGQQTFNEFLDTVKINVLKAFDNQDYPFEKLVENLEIHRDLSRNPIFDTMFVLQNMSIPKMKLKKIKFAPYQCKTNIARFDLLLNAMENDGVLQFELEYCVKLFKKESSERLCRHFINTVKYVLKNPGATLAEIDILSGAEKKQLLTGFNNTEVKYPKNKTIHRLFEIQVKKTPQRIAAVSGERRLTYLELNERANQLARILRKKGIRPCSIVGLMMDRSPETVIGILAVLKAGGAYLPIDPEYPEQRIITMLRDSNTALLLTKSWIIKESLPSRSQHYHAQDNHTIIPKLCPNFNNPHSKEILLVDSMAEVLDKEPKENLSDINNSHDLVYVIYTSGSTGQPKGVMLEHRNLINLLYFQFTKTDIDFKTSILQFASLSFDVSFQEIFSALLSGGELHLLNDVTRKNILQLFNYISANKVKIVFLPTSYLKFVLNNKEYLERFPRTIKHIITAGEQLILTEQFADYLRENQISLHNHYGPTETHVVTVLTINPNEEMSTTPPIGKPISNTKVFILNETQGLLPVGVAGELYIAGESVGRGYLNRDELTAAKFMVDPFQLKWRMYRTGDLARWRPDGNLDFLGRIDHQVKIRGFRIELGEIESRLLQHEMVKEAAVLLKEDDDAPKYLCAYLVLKQEMSVLELRDYLLKFLPEYMIPAYFIPLDKMPLNPNGKVDREVLLKLTGEMNIGTDYEPPTNETESELVKIWASVLKGKEIGINDNFFTLGGDSLKIMQLVTHHLMIDWGVTIQDFYNYPTIKELSKKITGIFEAKRNAVYNLNKSELEVSSLNFQDNIILKRKNVIQNIFITGVTGFLGIHILDTLMKMTKVKVYCLVREQDNRLAENKLWELLKIYFSGKYTEEYKKRIIVFKGDITSERMGLNEDDYLELARETGMVIHSAAIVRHNGNYPDFERVNVAGTREVASFCSTHHKELYHISTIGVSGNTLDTQGDEKRIFTEHNLYIGQNYNENVYIRSKFEAEELILKAMKGDLQASIFRIGNLTGRSSDGHFQKNIFENAFYNRIKSIIALGVIPKHMLEQSVEFTPVDYCSKAIVKFIMREGTMGKVFHLFNHKLIKVRKMLKLLKSCGISIKDMAPDAFNEYIRQISLDDDKREILKGIIGDFNIETGLVYGSKISVDSQRTREYLRQMNFDWPEIDGKYLIKIIKHLNDVNYIIA